MTRDVQVALAKRAAAGDSEAAAALYEFSVPTMRAWLRKCFGFRNDTDDAIQDAWLSLLETHIGKFDGRKDFRYYAATLAEWSTRRRKTNFSESRTSSLDEALEQRNEDDPAPSIEPGFEDTFFEEREAYKRFFTVWDGMSESDKKLFAEAREWGEKLVHRADSRKYKPRFPHIHNQLRSALIGETAA